MPGHKRRLAGDELLEGIYGIDITEIKGFDDLHNANGILKEAEERCAKLFGADETHFLVNGSTCGILAAICGSVTEHDDIVIAKNCHRSVYNAVMLSGADLHVITPGTESCFGTYAGVRAKSVKEALKGIEEKKGKNRKRTAVIITSPTYEGITSDLKAIHEICRSMGAVFIVDAAHAAHFGFSEEFPENPTRYADVVITSVHKTLPAMTQTALIHIADSCPSKDRIRKMLSVFMTSSPSYVLMASIDSMTLLLEERGKELFDQYIKRLKDFRSKARSLKHLTVLDREMLSDEGSDDLDIGKIVIKDMTGCFSGPRLYDMLLEDYSICPEMATGGYVVLMTSIADTEEAFERLLNALVAIDKLATEKPVLSKTERKQDEDIRFLGNNMKAVLFDDDREYIPVALSKGRVAADPVTVYPPGSFAVIPGETISEDAVDTILEAMGSGLEETGLSKSYISR